MLNLMTMPYQESADPQIILKKGYQPRPHDVIFKNGTFLNINAGNQQLCMMIIENYEQYGSSKHGNGRESIIYDIINQILRGNLHQGIFVQRDASPKDQWKMMTIGEAFSKIESALEDMCREGSSESKTEPDVNGTGLRAIARLLETQRRILDELLKE
uniref:DUF6824 domain-containing protein n=1 Tax=Eucampia antarctica TaxID=49252 RepID=A0A7S2R026_9STRA